MPVQVQKSGLAKRLGAKITQAHQQTKDKPAVYGQMRLPPGIRNGVLKITSCEFGQYKADAKKDELKGQDYWRVGGIAVFPHDHDGSPVAGLTDSVIIPMCDTPSKQKPSLNWPFGGSTFRDNWDDMTNFFKWFGIGAPQSDDPNVIEAYYVKAGHDLANGPDKFVSFTTREWTPPVDPKKPNEKPQPMVFVTWVGPVDWQGGASVDPSTNGVVDHAAGQMAAGEPFTEPPAPTQTADTAATDEPDIATLIAIADADQQGETDEGKAAIEFLQQRALAAGLSEETLTTAPNWEAVEAMLQGGVAPETAAAAAPPVEPTKGAKVQYKGNECEVTSVNKTDKTVTLKNVKAKVAVLGTDKKLLKVKWEELK